MPLFPVSCHLFGLWNFKFTSLLRCVFFPAISATPAGIDGAPAVGTGIGLHRRVDYELPVRFVLLNLKIYRRDGNVETAPRAYASRLSNTLTKLNYRATPGTAERKCPTTSPLLPPYERFGVIHKFAVACFTPSCKQEPKDGSSENTYFLYHTALTSFKWSQTSVETGGNAKVRHDHWEIQGSGVGRDPFGR